MTTATRPPIKHVKNAAIGITLGALLGQLILGRPWLPALAVMLGAALIAAALIRLDPGGTR